MWPQPLSEYSGGGEGVGEGQVGQTQYIDAAPSDVSIDGGEEEYNIFDGGSSAGGSYGQVDSPSMLVAGASAGAGAGAGAGSFVGQNYAQQ